MRRPATDIQRNQPPPQQPSHIKMSEHPNSAAIGSLSPAPACAAGFSRLSVAPMMDWH
jgi:hypothetical protein